jgi:NADPH2:quinone reductase
VVIDTTLLAVQGLDLGHAPGDDPLRHAARAHARHGARAVRPRAGGASIVSEPQQVFALADAADAHRALESRKTTGATVLVP